MPIYDFVCKDCGYRFDRLTSIAARNSVRCPKCGGAVERVYEGKWSMCGKAPSGASGGCGCGGSGCAGCSGCGR